MEHDYELLDAGPAHEWWRCRRCAQITGRPDHDEPCPGSTKVYGSGKLTEEGEEFIRNLREVERKMREGEN
jgi:hypothetical protein